MTRLPTTLVLVMALVTRGGTTAADAGGALGECRVPTSTPVPLDVPSCPEPPRFPLGRVVFTMGGATTGCDLPATPPSSGRVDDDDRGAGRDLGLGCLYLGGGGATMLPAIRLPAGARSVLDVAGLRGLTVSLTASDGTGPGDCTRGAAPETHCLNAEPGIDGHGACLSDEDCAGTPGACDADAQCFFGAPLPVPIDKFSVCMVAAVEHDVCGSVDLASRDTTLAIGLSSRVYLTGNPVAPCPQCVSGFCSAGERAGLPCAEGVGADRTSVECPPAARQFLGRLDLRLSSLGTHASRLDGTDGNFCPEQRTAGAFGHPARAMREAGAPLLSAGLFDVTLAATFCLAATGNPLLDTAADLPGPGAISVPGSVSFDLLPRARSIAHHVGRRRAPPGT